MRRIFWDSMFFMFLLENHPEYFKETRRILEQSFDREDQLLTSSLVFGEVLAVPERLQTPQRRQKIETGLYELGFQELPFDSTCVTRFAQLRRDFRVKTADAVNLACAGAAGVDLFLTKDRELHGLNVDGIKFIGGLHQWFR